MGKIGYQVHNKLTYERSYNGDEEKHLFDHLARLRPSALLFLENGGWARRAKELLPNCAVVTRSWHPNEGGLHQDPQKGGDTLSPKQFFDRYASNHEGGLVVNVLNEPNGYGELPRLADWMAEAMDLFGNAGIPIVGPNWGEGHPDEKKLDELKPMWEAFKRWHSLHYYGIHEYGTWRGMLFEGAEFGVYPWRVGRFEHLTVPYLQGKGYPIPRVILTEWGVDSAHDNTQNRGWRTKFSPQEYANELQAAVDKIYCKPHYVGMCIFSYGNSGRQNTQEDWVTFDVADAPDLHTLFEQQADTFVAMVAALPEFPADFDARTEAVSIHVKEGKVNLRAKPSAQSDKVASVEESVNGFAIRSPKDSETIHETVGGKSGFWVPVKIHDPSSGSDVNGWIFSPLIELKQPDDETEGEHPVITMVVQPPNGTPNTTVQQLKEIQTALEKVAEDTQNALNQLNALLKQLQ